MKFPTIRREAGSAGKITEAQTALAAAEGHLAQLQNDRTAALGNDDIDGARRLDRQIAEQREACGTYADRVALLRGKVEQEQRDDRRRQYEEAVDRLAELLPRRLSAVDELAAGLRTVATALGKLHQETGALFRDWPSGVLQGRYGDRWRFDASGAERCLKDCLQTLLAEWPIDSRLREVQNDITKFAAAEAKYHADTIAELRALAPAEPEPEPEHDQEEAAA
jgi:hypothetical protein